MVERHLYTVSVIGSIPIGSTILSMPSNNTNRRSAWDGTFIYLILNTTKEALCTH